MTRSKITRVYTRLVVHNSQRPRWTSVIYGLSHRQKRINRPAECGDDCHAHRHRRQVRWRLKPRGTNCVIYSRWIDTSEYTTENCNCFICCFWWPHCVTQLAEQRNSYYFRLLYCWTKEVVYETWNSLPGRKLLVNPFNVKVPRRFRYARNPILFKFGTYINIYKATTSWYTS